MRWLPYFLIIIIILILLNTIMIKSTIKIMICRKKSFHFFIYPGKKIYWLMVSKKHLIFVSVLDKLKNSKDSDIEYRRRHPNGKGMRNLRQKAGNGI